MADFEMDKLFEPEQGQDQDQLQAPNEREIRRLAEVTRQLDEDLVQRVSNNTAPAVKVAVFAIGGFVQIKFDGPIDKLLISKQHARQLATRLNKESMK